VGRSPGRKRILRVEEPRKRIKRGQISFPFSALPNPVAYYNNKKGVLSQGNCAMPQLLFLV